jgi:hypothetical protein
MGWSTATTVRMAKRYGHVGHAALRSAVESISTPMPSKKEPEKDKKQPGSFDNPFDLSAGTDDEVSN